MKLGGWGKSINFAIGKYVSSNGEKERRAFQRSMLARQNELDDRLWHEVKNRIRNFSDDEFEALAEFIDTEVCQEPRRYSDPRHEVYSRLKHDMISHQYEKVLKKIK
jgi:hypothetical protein